MAEALASALRAHQGQPSGRDTELKVAEEVLLPPLQKLVAQLEGLDEPTDGRGELEHVVAAFKSGLEKAEASPSNLLDSNTFSPARHRSKAAGLTECNQF